MQHRTAFQQPVLNFFLQKLAILILRLIGWTTEGEMPKNIQKCVIIAAPHTSNWDMPMMMVFAFRFKLKIYWMGKHTIFKKPFYHIMRWLGGVPIDRTKPNGVVQQAADVLKASDTMMLVVPPEGTRGGVSEWKSGFYHIAYHAEVPIVCSFLDYGRKVAGFGPVITPSGDHKKEIPEIREFYKNVQGKYPDRFVQKEDI